MNDASKMEFNDLKKLQTIIGKLKNFGSISDDQWFGETLTKPGSYRYILIEQILSKLKYPVPFESGHVSDDEKLKYFHVVLSNLGICRKNNDDVIKGIAPINKQLIFWEKLVDILWMKSRISSSSFNSDEGYTSVERENISEAYEQICSYIDKLCNSVEMNVLFDEKVQLFPLNLEMEIEQSSGTCIKDSDIYNLKGSKNDGQEEQNSEVCRENLEKDLLEKNLIVPKYEDLFNDSDEAIVELEEKLSQCIDELQFCAQSNFKDAYDTLKSYTLDASPTDVLNIGPKFKQVVPKLESLLQLKNSLTVLKTSDSKLKDVFSDVKSFEISDKPLSDSVLAHYTAILKSTVETSERADVT